MLLQTDHTWLWTTFPGVCNTLDVTEEVYDQRDVASKPEEEESYMLEPANKYDRMCCPMAVTVYS